MSKPYTRLGATLDEAAYDWLLDEHPKLAEALETEVLAGADPDSIGRYMAQHIGEHRQALIARCVSAARWLHSSQAR